MDGAATNRKVFKVSVLIGAGLTALAAIVPPSLLFAVTPLNLLGLLFLPLCLAITFVVDSLFTDTHPKVAFNLAVGAGLGVGFIAVALILWLLIWGANPWT